MQLKTAHPLLTTCGVILAVISIYWTIQMFIGLSDSPIDKIALGIAGATMDIAKLALLVIGLSCFFTSRIGYALIALLFYVVLTASSILASMGFFLDTTGLQEKTAITADTRYQTQLSQVKTIDEQITQLKQNPRYNARNPQNKVRIDSQINALLEQRKNAVDKLDTLATNGVTTTGGQLYEGLARLANDRGYKTDAKTIKSYWAFIVAILIELLSGTCLAIGRLDTQDNSMRYAMRNEPQPAITQQPIVTQPASPPTVTLQPAVTAQPINP